MSNQDGLTAEAPVAEPEINDPAGGAPAIEADPGTTSPEPDPEPDYLDIDDDLANKHVKVTVDGEELSVPLREALSGYSRTADYTRKTQDLAEQRRQAEEAMQVYQAFQTNPGLTVQVLANRAGMGVEEFLGLTPQQQQAAVQEAEDEFETLDPMERELRDTRRQVEEMRRQMMDREADARLHQVVDGLKETYQASDDDVRAAVIQTHKMGLGISEIPMVFRSMQFDRAQARTQAEAQAEEQRRQEEARRQAAAAAATGAISDGGSAAGVTQQAPNQQPTSIRDAIEGAFAEVESRSQRR